MTIRSLILADSPYWYLPLDETSGTTAFDASGNGRHGTYMGNTLPLWDAGRGPDCEAATNRSIGFGGNDAVSSPQRIQTTHFPASGSNVQTSVEVWALMDPASVGERCPFSWRTDQGSNVSEDLWSIASHDTREWRWRIASSNERVLDWHYHECWHHVACVATAGERQFWLDGEQVDGRQQSSTLASGDAIGIGCDLRKLVHSPSDAPHRVWHGRLAHAAAYSYALTPRQIKARWSETCRRCVGWVSPGGLKRPLAGRVSYLAT